MSKSGLPGRSGEFFTLLEELRVFRAQSLAGDPADRALARAAGVSPTTIGIWLRGRCFPQDIGQILAVVRTVQQAASRRGVAIPVGGPAGLLDQDRWRSAYREEAQRRAGVVSGGVEQAQAVWALAGSRVRVREADLRLLGVHAAISVPGVLDEVPPEYVPRDVDAAEFGVRAKVAAAAQRGGFVLLVGGSSVGKTRTAVETVKTLLPEWWLVHPAGPAEVTALAQALPPQTVVWLDELQHYLDGKRGLTGAAVRALLTSSPPAVLIGTLWPDRYANYTAMPQPGRADSHAREREVLDLATVVRIGPEFSPAEQDRARAAAARDPRLRIALGAAGYGLTQTLAAAPQLVARWEDAETASPYACAVLTAALDAARLGARAPLSAGFLRDAAPGYCTSQQQAEAPENWFEQALDYATEKLHGAAAALTRAGAGMGHVIGYTVADYLIQHASRKRRSVRAPASTWNAIACHIRPLSGNWHALGLTDVYLTRSDALADFGELIRNELRCADEVSTESEQSETAKPRLWIVGSSMKGLLECASMQFDGLGIFTWAASLAAAGKLDLRIIMTHPEMARSRASQEDRAPNATPEEIIDAVNHLRREKVPPEYVKMEVAIPTVFAVATRYQMLLNPYLYSQEAFHSFTLTVHRSHANRDISSIDRDIFEQYERRHFARLWVTALPLGPDYGIPELPAGALPFPAIPVDMTSPRS